MNIFSRITVRTMLQNRTRTAVTVIGVILSAAMITAVASFGVSFRQFLVDYSISRDGNWHLAVSGISAEEAEELAGREEVASDAVVTELGWALFEPVQEQSPLMPYLYIKSFSEEALEVLPIQLSEGRLPETAEEIVIPSYLQANEDEDQITRIGDTLTLELGERTYQGEHLTQYEGVITGDEELLETFTPYETRSFQVVGIYTSWANAFWGDAGYEVLAGPLGAERATTAALAGAEEEKDGASQRYQDLYLTLKHPGNVFRLGEEISSAYNCGVIYNSSLLRWLGVVDNDNFYTVVTGLMGILMLVILTGSVTLICNAFSISLRERTAQFGLLSSIGATKRQLRSSMRCEALLVGAVGIPLGILAGITGAGITLHYIGSSITNWVHGVKSGIPLVVSPEAVLASVVLSFVMILLSVWLPSYRIRKISPMEAIRSNTDIRIRPGEVKTGGWMIRVFGLEGMLAEKNYKRDRKKYRATVISLTMSIVLFMAAALFNIYLMQTGAFVLEAPETDLEYQIYDGTDADTVKQVGELIGRVQGITSVLSYSTAHLVLQVPEKWVNPAYHGFYDMDAEETTETTFVELTVIILPDDAFTSFAEECGVDASPYLEAEKLTLLYRNDGRQYNAQTQRYERTRVFEKTDIGTLPSGRFEDGADGTAFKPLGEVELGNAVSRLPSMIEDDFNSPVAFIPESMYTGFSDDVEIQSASFSIRCDNTAEVYERLDSELGRSGLDYGYLQNVSAEYESDRNALMAVRVLVYGFVALISLIAVANIFNTVSTNLMLRRREFAMLRSMGMSPRGFWKMMNYECLIYSTRACIYGILISLLLGFAIQKVIGTGVDVAFLIPWKYLAAAVAGTVLIVFITMLYTMHKMKKNNIVNELKMD